jgi:hypothetical protein
MLIPVKHSFRPAFTVLTVADGGTPGDTFFGSFTADAAPRQ